jgi:squalene-hopene/tetraprenyl-beta-curcumene cyclase
VKPGRRPDLSNSQFVIESLRVSGIPATDPSIQNAVVFVSRTQATDANDMTWSKGQPHDGGFIYSMGFNKDHGFYGESEGPDTEREGSKILTTYGSMTYAGLRSLIFADLKKDDPRVQVAMRWIRGSYTLDVNPGLNNEQGLYYYYHTFASCLNAYGEETITDAGGKPHAWREEFNAKMASLQKPDGSYMNSKDRWMESMPVLVTTYVALGLQNARGLK